MRVIFDDFELDSERRELFRRGVPLHLSPKAFDLLEILVSERPRAVPKQELQERIWRDVIVEEANLTNLVSELRGVLADHPRRPLYIKTVHGFGYAFVAEASDPTERPPNGTGFPKRQALMIAAGVALVFVAILVVAALKRASSLDAQGVVTPDPPVVVTPIRTAESLRWAAASPDGRFLAYSTQAPAKKTIRLLHLETGAEVELTPLENVHSIERLDFSPDGSFIYYLFNQGGGNELRRVSVLGGPPETVIEGRDSILIKAYDL
ncbi:MAG: winged helix-turn-helix domain-containing protein, partial [Thermoanaerobaculia bacterium]|nr:winged helix-turn-helix domain-containing protein [Thermoanaerobaculia bacterium]